MTLPTSGKPRQFVVEFIRGTGIRTNGIVDSSQGTTGPFVWRVPQDVTQLTIAMCSGGSGGSGGGASAASVISIGGGGGGPAGINLFTLSPATVVPNTDLKITVGKSGSGSAAGVDAYLLSTTLQPGFSYVEGNTGSDPGILAAFHDGVSGRVRSPSYGGGVKGSTSTTGFAAGGGSWGNVDTNGAGAGGNVAGGSGGSASAGDMDIFGGGTRWRYIHNSGGGGAAGAATGSTAGGSNLYQLGGGGNPNYNRSTDAPLGPSGTTDGNTSYGAGGNGGGSFFGRGGRGGNGNANGSTGLGYGAGGGGGGGNGTGADGTPGYVRFVYWSTN